MTVWRDATDGRWGEARQERRPPVQERLKMKEQESRLEKLDREG